MNIIVIIADQLRADHLGFEGVQPVRTPNIDRLAANGTVFTRAFVANPVCMPNRATIMTGRWPSAHGLRTNGLPLSHESKTFPRVLREEGWSTSAVGKLHLQPMGYPFEDYQLDEIKETLPALWDAAVEEFGTDFVSWEDYQRHVDGDVQLPEDYYGFDDVTLAVGHGDRVSGNYLRWARERGHDPLTQAGVAASTNVFAGWNHVYESAVPAELHPTSFVTDEAIARINEWDGSTDHALLYVSYPDPHHPFAPPREYFNRYAPEDVELPLTFHDEHQNSPDYIKRMAEQRGVQNIDPMMTWAPTEEQFRAALAAELGSIEFLDDSIGRILTALDESGQADNTIIVFTADHGDVFGDHGLMLKHFTHYRGVTRVPLIIDAPGAAPGVCNDIVGSADIAPTLLELVGAPALTKVQGDSLSAAIRGAGHSGRGAALIEEDQPFGIEGLAGPVRMRTVVTDRLRLTEIAGTGIYELYDLQADPDELHNLAGVPEAAGLLAEGRQVMLEQVLARLDAQTIPFHAA